MTNEETTEPVLPVLRVTSGNPTAEEIAAVSVVLAAVTGGGDDNQPRRRRGWARPARRLLGGFAAGSGWGRR